eukprot:CAMPEP_0168313900 /NCGR_PEP_ID=MMETSP0210-20121227/5195_1 /TAXON_ID=40633 /ORGANISM="Condylostoma magnum, Strain COL2" /LENGTH=45 /DNA_ID= /DNA_START= /DNA_END= /DNA_ORIENTATION=
MKEAMELQEDDDTQDESNPEFAPAYDLDTINEEDEDRDDEIEEIA